MSSKRTSLLVLAALVAGVATAPRLIHDRASLEKVAEAGETTGTVGSAADVKHRESLTHDHNHDHDAHGLQTVAIRPASRAYAADTFNSWDQKNKQVSLSLPDGRTAKMIVDQFNADSDGNWTMVSGRISEPSKGTFIFIRQPEGTESGAYEGAIRFQDGGDAYQLKEAPEGGPQLIHLDADKVSCIGLPPRDFPDSEPLVPREHPTDVDIPGYQNGVIPLSSRPGEAGVLYLDFDGEAGPFPGWGDFDAEPSGASNTQVFDVWARVAEDFAPFNINVTTDLQVYLDADPTSRQRCILTPTTDAAPGAGGVAFIGSWNWAGDTPCWAFYSVGKSAAEVVSHEVGHTLKLEHDGQTNGTEYYGGHGDGDTGWAPIMGVGYYQNVSQWSKGEYALASQLQDDLAVMDTMIAVDYSLDDHGNGVGDASPLELFGAAVDDDGVISTRTDVDVFAFTTRGGNLSLKFDPVAEGPNLDLSVELRNSSGSVIASSNPDAALNASINFTALPAGNYTIWIDGVGRGSLTGDGYSDYGSLGHYEISGTIAGAIPPARFSVQEFAPVGTQIGAITPNNNHGASNLTYSIASGNSSGAFVIGTNSGVISVARSSALDYSVLSKAWNDPAELELYVLVTDSANPTQNEFIRVVVTVIDLNSQPPVTLAHRYSFETDAGDLFGTADLSLKGAATVSGGKLNLPGGGARTNHAEALGTALTEVAATIGDNTALTIEGWFTQSAAQDWSKLFMAGSPSGSDYMDLTPRRGTDDNVSSLSVRANDATEINVKSTGSTPLDNNTPYYFAAVWNESDNQLVLHIGPVGGSLSKYTASMGGVSLSDLSITQFHLGAAVSFGDPDYQGSIDEFRIWNGGLSDARVEANFAAGPDPADDSDIDGLPDTWELSFASVTSLSDLEGNLPAGGGPGAGTGDFDGDGLSDREEYNAGIQGTDPTDADSDDDLFSDYIERIRGTDPNDPESVPSVVLAHRYSFEVDATDVVHSADFELVGNASVSGGSLDLPGGAHATQYATLTGTQLTEMAETINQSPALTTEIWVRQEFARSWAKLLMTGRGFGDNYLSITPRRGTAPNRADLAINDGAGESFVEGVTLPGFVSGTPNTNPPADYYIACVWNPTIDQMTMHVGPVGGALSTFTGSMGGKKLSDIVINEFYLGRSVQFEGDPDFDGKVHELRVWSGGLSSEDISASFAAGPGQPAGDVDLDELPDEWEFAQPGVNHLDDVVPSVDDDHDGLTNLEEYQNGTLPMVVDTDGDHFGDGFEVSEGSDPLDINSTPEVPEPKLLHRYAFAGNTADAVKHADLTLIGNAAISGGELELPGGGVRRDYARAQGPALATLSNSLRNPYGVTIECWFNQDIGQSWSKLFMAGHGAGNGYMDMTPRRATDSFAASISFSDGEAESYVPRLYLNSTLSNNTNYYFAGVWNPIDDQLVIMIGRPGSSSYTATTTLGGRSLEEIAINQFALGASVEFNDPDFNGQISEFRIWSGALSPAALQASFTAGTEAPPGDSDGDGLADAWEFSFANVSHLEDMGAEDDPDNDGLTNLEEFATTETDPFDDDSDDDGFKDGAEVLAGTDPNDAGSVPAAGTPHTVDVVLSQEAGMLTLSFEGLTPGAVYHLEEGAGLVSLAPMDGSQFTAAGTDHSVEIPVDPATTDRRFFRLVEGPQP